MPKSGFFKKKKKNNFSPWAFAGSLEKEEILSGEVRVKNVDQRSTLVGTVGSRISDIVPFITMWQTGSSKIIKNRNKY